MNKTQKGFAALEALLVLIIIMVIGGIGWYAYNSKTKTDKILSQADKISQSVPTPHKTSDYEKCVSSPGSKTEQTYPLVCVTRDGKTYTQKYDTSYCADNGPFAHPDVMIENHGMFVSYDEKKATITYKDTDFGTTTTDSWCKKPYVESSGSNISLSDLKAGDRIILDSDWSGIRSIYKK